MGGIYFSRRESTDVGDLFIAHISGMDTMARGLRNAARIMEVTFAHFLHLKVFLATPFVLLLILCFMYYDEGWVTCWSCEEKISELWLWGWGRNRSNVHAMQLSYYASYYLPILCCVSLICERCSFRLARLTSSILRRRSWNGVNPKFPLVNR